MKKITAKIVAIALSLICLFSFASCAEVENGSKIERMTIKISFTNADGEAKTYDIHAKMYLNYAPATTAHVKELISNGYYTNLDVSALTATYFTFGDYSVDLTKADPLTSIDQGVKTIKGEFSKNGFTGNKLTISQGAILLRRGEEGINDGSKYDSGKATLAVMLSASAPFSTSAYCVFAQIVSDDGNKEADSSSDEYLSSLDKVLQLKDCIADSNGRKIYKIINDDTDVKESTEDEPLFNIKGQYFTLIQDEDGNDVYYKGVHTYEDLNDPEYVSDEITLSDDEKSDLLTKLGITANYVTIPTVSVKIVSITLDK